MARARHKAPAPAPAAALNRHVSAGMGDFAQTAQRHALVTAFRADVMRTCAITPFPHQAEWMLATEGWTLTAVPPARGDTFVVVTIPETGKLPREPVLTRFVYNNIPCIQVRRKTTPRCGTHTIAHHSADLAAFKGGKSYSLALWASGFGCLPDAKVEFIGLEYNTSEPEYNYLLDFLVSDEYGMGMKYTTLQNDTRGGRMRVVLETGAEFKVASWNRKESLKGKKRDAYVYTEAYQLPGLEVYTSVSQNLRERRGFAVFATTPDRPWVMTLHERGHGEDPDWHCTCGIDASANPFTYDQRARDRDDPEKGGLMTRERYEIAWNGRLGAYVGQVYGYQRGQYAFGPHTHPQLFLPSAVPALD